MKSINKIIMIVIIFLSLTSCEAQIKNKKTATVKVYGNCEMCKKTIEKAANEKDIVKADWDHGSKLLSLRYDSKKITTDVVLKKVAYMGYDSDIFLAPDEAYNRLRKCCQYIRPVKTERIDQSNPFAKEADKAVEENITTYNLMDNVYRAYFSVKDALVVNDGKAVSVNSAKLLKAIAEVPMDKMKSEQHTIWMNVVHDLQKEAKLISETKSMQERRVQFAKLSANMFSVLKVFKTNGTIYYQYCPMFNKGANWLSKEEIIKNPYYGSSMLTCGNTIEIIK